MKKFIKTLEKFKSGFFQSENVNFTVSYDDCSGNFNAEIDLNRCTLWKEDLYVILKMCNKFAYVSLYNDIFDDFQHIHITTPAYE